MDITALMAKFDEKFVCVDGPPSAYFELPYSSPDRAPFRVEYVTVASCAVTKSP